MKEIINTTNAPAPIGPYNQAVKAGGFLFVSGQIPIDPKTNLLVEDGIEKEAVQVLENLKAILQEAGLGFHSIVKTSIFLSDMAHFATVNEVYKKYVPEPFPARDTVAVKTLPRNVNVEIAVIAIFG